MVLLPYDVDSFTFKLRHFLLSGLNGMKQRAKLYTWLLREDALPIVKGFRNVTFC